MLKNTLRSSAAITLAMGLGLPAFAQDAQDAADPAAGLAPASGEDVIIVTARKREESIQDVPLSISAFSQDAINDLGARDLSELSDFTPGFALETFGGRRGAEGDTQRPVIRGQANILGETNAQVFVDGVPFTGSFLSFPFATVDRIEVVKGPQAALFGRATFAGAINVITKRGSNEFQHNVTATVATQDEVEVNASSAGPLIADKLFYFAHARYYDYGGAYDNTLTGDRVGQEQSYGFNGALEFRASENLTLLLRAGYNEDDDGIPAQVAQSRFFNNCFLDQARQYYCGEVQEFDAVTLDVADLQGEEGLRRDITRVVGSAEWDIGGSGYNLTANAGWTQSDSVFGVDATFLGDPINFAGGTLVRVEILDQEERSAELRLDTPAERTIRGTVGGFYYDLEKVNFRRQPGSDVLIADFGTSDTDNWAIFAAGEVDLTPALTARAELRYQEDTIGVDQASGTRLENTFTALTPRFTLDYEWSDNVLLYGVAARGNKPGVINTSPDIPEDVRFADEEEVWSYEVGAKTTLMDGALNLNLAAFYIDWTNQQLTSSIFVDDVPESIVTNAGESEVTGLELEAVWNVNDAWDLGFSYALADAELTDFCDPIQGAELTGFDCVNAAGVEGGQVAGNQIPNAPKHQVTASSAYTDALGDTGWSWFVRGDYAYTSEKYAQVANLASTGDRNLINLKFGVDDGPRRLTFFVDNVTDDRTPSTVVRYADLGNLNIGPQEDPAQNNAAGSTAVERAFLFPLAQPRQYGVTLSVDF
ncbi:MAG: TonB-dependent receptor [Caulobacterales bacterium]|nr:TonB-dependent receptor [Caulobacterales bacterium]